MEFNEFVIEQNISTTYQKTDKDISCILIIPNYNINDDNASIKEKEYVNIGGIKKPRMRLASILKNLR